MFSWRRDAGGGDGVNCTAVHTDERNVDVCGSVRAKATGNLEHKASLGRNHRYSPIERKSD